MKKRSLVIFVLGLLSIAPAAVTASDVSDATFYGTLRVTNASTAATVVSVPFTLSTQNMLNKGYINSNFTNVAIRNGSGTDVAFMPAQGAGTNWMVFVDSIAQGQISNYGFYTGGSTAMGGALRYFPGDAGMTVPDAASLELGGNFELEIKGYFNTSSGVDKNIVRKDGSLGITVSADNILTATIEDVIVPKLSAISSTANKEWSNHSNLAVSSTGRLFAVYTKTAGSYNNLMIDYSDDGGATWVNQRTMAGSASANYFNPAIAVDSADRVYIVYYIDKAGGPDIDVSKYSSGTWLDYTAESLAITPSTTGCAIAVDSSDYIHIVFVEENGGADNVRYLKSTNYAVTWTNGAWLSAQTVYDVVWLDLAISPSDDPRVVFVADTDDVFPQREQVWFTELSGTWQAPVKLSRDEDDICSTPTICIDSSGNDHVAWGSYGNSGAPGDYVGYNKRTSGTWGSIEYINSTSEGYCQIFIDQAGDISVVFEKYSDGKIYLSTRTAPNTWTAPAALTASAAHLNGRLWAYYPIITSVHTNWPETSYMVTYIVNTDDLKLLYPDDLELIATAVTAGTHTVSLASNGTTVSLSVDGVSKDSEVFSGESITNNANNWTFFENYSMPYVEYAKVTVGGVLKGHWYWQNAVTFTDQSGNGNTATPTFRTTTTDADVTAVLLSYQAIYNPVYPVPIPEPVTSAPDEPSFLFTELEFDNVPGAAVINSLLDAATLPYAIFWFPLIFTLSALLGMGSFALSKDLFVPCVVSALWLFLNSVPFQIVPAWVLFPYAVFAVEELVRRRFISV